MAITSEAAQTAMANTEALQRQVDVLFEQVAKLQAAQRTLARQHEELSARVAALEGRDPFAVVMEHSGLYP